MEYLYAFLTGGAICVVGQILMDATKLTTPRVLVLLVSAGAVLQALGLYERLVEFAATGARVPLPGFGYNLARGAAAGGISVAIGWGYLMAVIFNPKSVR